MNIGIMTYMKDLGFLLLPTCALFMYSWIYLKSCEL